MKTDSITSVFYSECRVRSRNSSAIYKIGRAGSSIAPEEILENPPLSTFNTNPSVAPKPKR